MPQFLGDLHDNQKVIMMNLVNIGSAGQYYIDDIIITGNEKIPTPTPTPVPTLEIK